MTDKPKIRMAFNSHGLDRRIEHTIGSIQYINLGCQAIATVGEIPPEVQQLRDVLDQCLEDQRTLKALLEQRKD